MEIYLILFKNAANKGIERNVVWDANTKRYLAISADSRAKMPAQ